MYSLMRGLCMVYVWLMLIDIYVYVYDYMIWPLDEGDRRGDSDEIFHG